MSEPISGVAGQLIQQILENQSSNQQSAQSSGKRNFDSYMQQDKNMQIQQQDDLTTPQTGKIDTTQNPTTSGAEMQRKLDELGSNLTQEIKPTDSGQNKINDKMLSDFLNTSDTRLGLLRDASRSIGKTSKATSDLSGQLTRTEAEYKSVEAIMNSNKDLSPGELLALQARLYQVSQHIEVMSKVVDQMAGGIKTVLNTNI